MAYDLLKQMLESEFAFDTSMVGGQDQDQPSYGHGHTASASSYQSPFTATNDKQDIVSIDVPTFIRILEWAHEDAKDDVSLHEFAAAAIVASFEHNPLTMADYVQIVASLGNAPADKQDQTYPDPEANELGGPDDHYSTTLYTN
jgi:hypothetical protein